MRFSHEFKLNEKHLTDLIEKTPSKLDFRSCLDRIYHELKMKGYEMEESNEHLAGLPIEIVVSFESEPKIVHGELQPNPKKDFKLLATEYELPYISGRFYWTYQRKLRAVK